MTVPSDVLRSAMDEAGKKLVFDGTLIGDDVEIDYAGGSGSATIDTGVSLGDVETGNPSGGQIQFLQLIVQAFDEKDEKKDAVTGTLMLGWPGGGTVLPASLPIIGEDLGDAFGGALPIVEFLALVNGNLGIEISGDGDVKGKLRVAIAPPHNLETDPFGMV